METISKIRFKIDPSSGLDIGQLLKLNYPHLTFSIEEVHKDESEGYRNFTDITQFSVESGIAAGFLTNIIYDICKTAFLELNKNFRSKPPKAIIKLMDGTKIELPESLTDEEAKMKIKLYIEDDNYDYIRFK